MISVVIPTHNPRSEYIARAIDGLRRQTLPLSEWELIVVDNASEPPIAGRLDVAWHPQGRIERDDTLGLTPARLRGIASSTGDIIVFVDDDNVLDSDYLECVVEIARSHPFIGAFSGQARPEFETAPEAWTQRYWGNLVLREFNSDKWSNIPGLVETMPLGAGLCIRRDVASHYAHLHESGQREFLLDRTGKRLLSGGDTDLVCCAFDTGLGAGIFASLKLVHLIPPDRMTEDYLVKLTEGISYSAVILNYFRPGLYPPEGPRSLIGRGADLARALRMGRRARRFDRANRRGAKRATIDLSASLGKPT